MHWSQQSPITAWDLLFQQAIHKEIRKSPLIKDDQVPTCHLRKKKVRKPKMAVWVPGREALPMEAKFL